MDICKKAYVTSAKLGYKVVSGLLVIKPLKVMVAKQEIPTRMTAVICLFVSLKSSA